MSQVLKFTIVNAQIATISCQVQLDDEITAEARFDRAVIEAAPLDRAGKTFTAVLPPEALEEFPEGSEIIVTLAPAQKD
jgi:hypothetical protein